MELQLLIIEVNKKLKDGLSIAKIESEKGYAKDYLRKKLNRAGFRYDKGLRQYVTQDNTASYAEKTHNNTKCYKDTNNLADGQFKNDEVVILREIIKNFKRKQEVEKINLDTLKDKTITTRSFRSYKEIMDGFAKYCKDNKLNQCEAIAIALQDFINKK